MVIYLIRNGEGYYKIGRTTRSGKSRLKELQTGSATELTLVKECECMYGIRVENALHNSYRAYRMEGEWFDLPADIINMFEDKVRTLDKSFDALKDNPFVVLK